MANGLVYVRGVSALNASNGAVLWSYTTGSYDSSPAVANGMVYIGSYYGFLASMLYIPKC